jgi:hypothetical protein
MVSVSPYHEKKSKESFKCKSNYSLILVDPNLFPHGATAPSVPGPRHYRGLTITFRHTTLVSTPLDE